MSSAGPGVASRIHPTAIVDPGAHIPASASIGPYSIIGPGVELGERVQVASHVLVGRDTSIGDDCALHHGAVVGTDPQDLKYDGEASRLEIGPRTVVREYCTMNRGTGDGGVTRVGSDCLLMANVHVAHDCVLGDHAILASGVGLAGHVEIGNFATIGGVTGIHQFVRIGDHAFIGGCSRVAQDVPPYFLVAGNPGRPRGINIIGLKRRGFDEEGIRVLRRAYRALYKSDRTMSEAVEDLSAMTDRTPELDDLLSFIRDSERGVVS